MRRTVIFKDKNYTVRFAEPECEEEYEEIKQIPQVFDEDRSEQVIQEEEEEKKEESQQEELMSQQYPLFYSLFGRKLKTAFNEPDEIEPIKEIDFDPVMPFVRGALEQDNSQIQEENNDFETKGKKTEIKTDFYFLQFPEEPKYEITAGFEFENYIEPRDFAREMRKISLSNVRSPPTPIKESGFDFSVEYKPQIEVKNPDIFATAQQQGNTSYPTVAPSHKPFNPKFKNGSFKGKKPFKGKQ